MSQIFSLSPSHPMPLYAQLTRAIQFAIATGRLQIGEQLPTVRQLAVELRVNANTVAKVYAELERSGVLETRRGVGTFVCARHYEANSRHDHETSLRELVDRFMEEAAALGFTSDDLLDQLQSRRKKETKKNVQHYESNSNQKQSAVDKYTTR
jgi:GntR family transcriptional regulator